MPRIVLLGTGTSVGKSYVTRALVRSLAVADPGARIGALKPIESGLGSGELSDALALGQACIGCSPPAVHPLYGFSEPLTPYLAALISGAELPDLARVARWVSEWEEQVKRSEPTRRHWTLIETAGGVFSPLAPETTNFELARALEPCIWTLVAPDSLGVLHDLSATLLALGSRGRATDHVVLSEARTADASTGTNARVLAELSIAKPVGVLRRNGSDLADYARLLTRDADQTAIISRPPGSHP